MLERAINIKSAIEFTILSEGKKCKKLILNPNEWHLIKCMIDILAPFKETTLNVSQAKSSVSLAFIFPAYGYCLDSLDTSFEKYNNDFNDLYDDGSGMEELVQGITVAKDKLTHHYDQMSPIVGITLILHPEMKESFLKISL
jgi:hypothetical protein